MKNKPTTLLLELLRDWVNYQHDSMRIVNELNSLDNIRIEIRNASFDLNTKFNRFVGGAVVKNFREHLLSIEKWNQAYNLDQIKQITNELIRRGFMDENILLVDLNILLVDPDEIPMNLFTGHLGKAEISSFAYPGDCQTVSL